MIDRDSTLKNGRKRFNEFITWLVVIDTSSETNIADVRERKNREGDRELSYYKLNRVTTKRISRMVSTRKNILPCVLRVELKKRSSEKRKISSEGCRFVEKLHAPARRNFPRRRVIVREYDDLWQADIVEMRPYSSFNRGHHYVLTVIDTLSTRGPYHLRARVEARRLMLLLR